MNQITAVLLGYVASGLWQASSFSDSDRALAAALGRPLLRVDLSDVKDKASLMDALARDLGFGKYFGGNFDALEECLHDLDDEVMSAVVLEHGETLMAGDPKLVSILNQVFEDVSTASGRSFVWISADAGVPVIPNYWAL